MSAPSAPSAHTREAELLAAIYAAPDDDDPRAVYADWLSERDDPRGEFIALQLRRAHGGLDVALEAREHELLAAHGAAWRAPLPIAADGVRFERGFVVRGRTQGFLDDHPAWSTVREVDSVPATDACHTHSLRVVTSVGNGGILRLAQLARPLAVEELTWNGPSAWQVMKPVFPEPAIAAFGEIRVLPKLRRLTLFNEPMRPAELAWAWTSRYLPVLAELALTVEPRALASYAAALAPTRLWQIELRTETQHDLARAWRAIFTRDAAGALSELALVAPSVLPRARDHADAIGEGLAALPPTLTRVRLAIPAAAWDALEAVRDRIRRIVAQHQPRATLTIESLSASLGSVSSAARA